MFHPYFLFKSVLKIGVQGKYKTADFINEWEQTAIKIVSLMKASITNINWNTTTLINSFHFLRQVFLKMPKPTILMEPSSPYT